MDFEKAYDKMNRQLLIDMLIEKGCGTKFVSAIANSLKTTKNKIEDNEFMTTQGIKQGGPSSGHFFNFHIAPFGNKI